MSLLNLEVFEKVKPTFASLINIFFGASKSKKNSDQEISVFGDKIVKSGSKDLNSTPLTRKVWVNGQPFTIIGFSQQELNIKVEKIQQKHAIIDENKNLNPLLFPSLYTEQKEVEENEWIQKRDVWINEYFPA